MYQPVDDEAGACQMLPLTTWQHKTSVIDITNLLLSLAHFTAADWQSSLNHFQHVQSRDFYPFCCYLKGNYAVVLCE